MVGAATTLPGIAGQGAAAGFNINFFVTNTEKDLGVMISVDLKLTYQCSKVVETANKLVGLIGRTLEHKSEKKLF